MQDPKHPQFSALKLTSCLLGALALSACGGGSSDGGDSGGGNGGGGTTTTFTVSTSTNEGITLAPTSAQVPQGQTTAFDVQVSGGFDLSTIEGCNGSYSDGVYTTGPINSPCTVSATARVAQLTIRSSINPEAGSINPSSNSIESGQTTQFTAELNEFYSITEITGCATEEPEDLGDRRFRIRTQPLFAACTVQVQADLPGNDVFYTASVIVHGGGSVDAEEKQANFQETLSFEFTPDEGYELVGVSGCGGSLDGLTFTTAPMTEDCGIQAQFIDDSLVYFEDDNLRNSVRSALNITPVSVTREQMANLTQLNANGRNITSLVGLEHAVNLHTLQLNNNRDLSDISPLHGLPLETVLLDRTAVSRIDALFGAPLERLHIEESNVERLDGIESFSDMIDLRFSFTTISDISGLASLASLNVANLQSTRVTDLRPLLESGLGQDSIAYYSGCVSSTQAISRRVDETLAERGVMTYLPDFTTRQDCPEDQGPIADIVMDFNDAGNIVAQWNITNLVSPEDATCELHINLQRQTTRVPHAVVESCPASGELELETFFDHARVSLVVDDGLHAPVRVNTPQALNPNRDRALFLANADWGQAVLKRNPYLVPNRAAMYRVELLSETGVTPPDVTLRLSGVSGTQTLTMNKPSSLGSTPNYISLNQSYHVEVPAAQMQDGLQIRVEVGGETLYEHTPTFVEPIPLYITAVPMVIGGTAPNMPSEAWMRDMLESHWPLSEVNIRVRAPYNVPANANVKDLRDLLIVLRDLRNAEGAQEHYHGFFNRSAIEDKRYAGMAYRPGISGVTWDQQDSDTFSHELGHNFSIGHINCGGPEGVENDFPYDPNQLGSVGVGLDNNIVFNPTNTTDLMSYCHPRHISDWVYEKAMDYLRRTPSLPFTGTAVAEVTQDMSSLASSPTVLEINGVIEPLGRTRIVSKNEISARDITFGSSAFMLEIEDSQGALHYASVAMLADSYSDGSQGGIFSAFTEVRDIVRLRILRNDTELLAVDMQPTR